MVSIWSQNLEPIHREICIWFTLISMWDLWYLWIVASWALVRRATMIYAERRHGKHPGYYQAHERDTRSAGKGEDISQTRYLYLRIIQCELRI